MSGLKIVWRNVLIMLSIHLGALYGLYLILTGRIKFVTVVWVYSTAVIAGLGITAGTHRLWAHRSYNARRPLRVLLMCFQTLALQNTIYEWVRDHRVHHKFTDTDADPHNSRRGFFFSHVGWLLVRKHEDVKQKGGTVNMEDVAKDPVVMFQKKYYLWLGLGMFCVPPLVTIFLGESYWNAWWVACMLRYAYTLNVTWLVNSAAHFFGYKPYDGEISATENIGVGLLALGEGWHNYHHVFPWDYKAAELPTYDFNFTLGFIDLMATIGWAYNLKTVSQNMIQKRVQRTGSNGSNPWDENPIWGWGDQDMNKQQKQFCQILY